MIRNCRYMPAATAAEACKAQGSSLCQHVWELTSNATVASLIDRASVVITIIGILITARLAQLLVRRSIRNALAGLQAEKVQRGLRHMRRKTPRLLLNTGAHATLRRAQRAETLGALMRSTSTAVIAVVAGLAILRELDPNLGEHLKPFVATTAIATAVIGFGAQNVIRDLLSGLFIVFEDQYGVGDVIEVGTSTGAVASGTVEYVSLRVTKIRDDDGTLWSVSNGEMRKVGNKSQQWVRAISEFHLALDSDIDQALEVFSAVAQEVYADPAFQPMLMEAPKVWGPESLDTEGIWVRLVVQTKPSSQWEVSRVLLRKVKAALDVAGIRLQGAPSPE